MPTGPTRVPKRTEAAVRSKEEMIMTILEVLHRTWTPFEGRGATRNMEDFLRRLDEPTLRAIGYQYGVFESDLEPGEPDDQSGREA